MFVCNVSLTYALIYCLENEQLTNTPKRTPYYGLFLYKFLKNISKIWAKDADVFFETKFISGFCTSQCLANISQKINFYDM